MPKKSTPVIVGTRVFSSKKECKNFYQLGKDTLNHMIETSNGDAFLLESLILEHKSGTGRNLIPVQVGNNSFPSKAACCSYYNIRQETLNKLISKSNGDSFLLEKLVYKAKESMTSGVSVQVGDMLFETKTLCSKHFNIDRYALDSAISRSNGDAYVLEQLLTKSNNSIYSTCVSKAYFKQNYNLSEFIERIPESKSERISFCKDIILTYFSACRSRAKLYESTTIKSIKKLYSYKGMLYFDVLYEDNSSEVLSNYELFSKMGIDLSKLYEDLKSIGAL